MKNEKNEVRARWGNTDAYCEYEGKTKHYSKKTWSNVNDGLMAIFAEFAACRDRGAAADSSEACALAARLQAYITANYYTCTNEILAGLGKMYVCDERFRQNIDKHGVGTADFASAAIAAYCKGE